MNRVVVTRIFLNASGGRVVARENAKAPRSPPYAIINCSVHVIARTLHRFRIAVSAYVTEKIIKILQLEFYSYSHNKHAFVSYIVNLL